MRVLESIGRIIAHYLNTTDPTGIPSTLTEANALHATLRPGDVLLIDGNNRISGVIKYLTQSTWSHAALYVGHATQETGISGHLIEANLGEGVISVPLSKYANCHIRICRPFGISREDCERVCKFAIGRVGLKYDLKNIFDLARYLVPLPVPRRWRRRMISLGSGDPTRLICSGMIAQAFQSVRYPILPKITLAERGRARHEILEIRHSSLFVPRDFDISPYFSIVKPSVDPRFNYRAVQWADVSQDHPL